MCVFLFGIPQTLAGGASLLLAERAKQTSELSRQSAKAEASSVRPPARNNSHNIPKESAYVRERVTQHARGLLHPSARASTPPTWTHGFRAYHTARPSTVVP